MKKVSILFILLTLLIQYSQGQTGFAVFTGGIHAFRIPSTNRFSSGGFVQGFFFTAASLKTTGYYGLRRLRGKGYLGNNTDDFENGDIQKFMQLRLIDHFTPDNNSARIGWRYTSRINTVSSQYELGLYAHINHKANNAGREGYTFGLPTYKKFKLFEYSLIIGRSYGMAARIQYQGIDSTVWIIRTIEDWQSVGFTSSDAEASLYAEKGSSNAPIPIYINAFSSSVITPYYTTQKFWHVNVGMLNTWVKTGETKIVTAQNSINLLTESIVPLNHNNPTHPDPYPNDNSKGIISPYLKVESGGMLVVEAKHIIIADSILNNTYKYSPIEISHGGIAKFVIVP